MFTNRLPAYKKPIWIVCLLICYVLPASAQQFLPDSIDQKLIDSLTLEVNALYPEQLDSLRIALKEVFTKDEWEMIDRQRIIIPPDRVKNPIFSVPIQEIPGHFVYLPLPDDWRDMDPFARYSMRPHLPKRPQPYIPDYARFSQGFDGYYFAINGLGFYGWAWSDSIYNKLSLDITVHIEKGNMSPKLLKILGLSKDTLIILAIILQAVLL